MPVVCIQASIPLNSRAPYTARPEGRNFCSTHFSLDADWKIFTSYGCILRDLVAAGANARNTQPSQGQQSEFSRRAASIGQGIQDASKKLFKLSQLAKAPPGPFDDNAPAIAGQFCIRQSTMWDIKPRWGEFQCKPPIVSTSATPVHIHRQRHRSFCLHRSPGQQQFTDLPLTPQHCLLKSFLALQH